MIDVRQRAPQAGVAAATAQPNLGPAGAGVVPSQAAERAAARYGQPLASSRSSRGERTPQSAMSSWAFGPVEPHCPTRGDFLLGQPFAVTGLMEPGCDPVAADVDKLLTGNDWPAAPPTAVAPVDQPGHESICRCGPDRRARDGAEVA
jgi:hypothetical protein